MVRAGNAMRVLRWTAAALLAVLAVGMGALAVEDGPAYDGFLICRQELPYASRPGRQADLFAEEAGLERAGDGVWWTESREQAADLLGSGWADLVEPNWYVELFDVDGGDGPPASDGAVPSDGGWAREALRAETAASWGLDGTGVRVAVIDSGVDPSLPDLQGAEILDGWDYLEETAEIRDTVSHGTKVIQMIAGDDDGRGVTGIAPRVGIVPLRCFSTSHNGTVLTLSQAIREAVDRFDCDVINMSWGVDKESEVLHRAIRHAYDAGALLIAAAGNVTASYRPGTVLYPAAFDETIGVGAVGEDLQVLSTSQKGVGVQVCAPGGGLRLIGPGGVESVESGTSFAAPCVTASAALLRQLAPFLDQSDLLSILRERAEDLGDEGPDPAYGYGFPRLDALLGTSWARIRTIDGGKTISGWHLSRRGGAVIAASYGATGRMATVASLLPEGDAVSFSLPAGDGAGPSAVFFLDEDLSVTDGPLRFDPDADGR